jgi:hypothetical protein
MNIRERMTRLRDWLSSERVKRIDYLSDSKCANFYKNAAKATDVINEIERDYLIREEGLKSCITALQQVRVMDKERVQDFVNDFLEINDLENLLHYEIE